MGAPTTATTVTVIVPVFNEERTLDELLRRLVAASKGRWQIVVNDGSADGTTDVLKEWGNTPGVEVCHHASNLGKGAAVRTALAHATGDVVIIQDADLEYDPADIDSLIKPFADEQVQAVYGTRYGAHSRLPWSRFRFAVALLNGIVLLLYGRRLRDEATCYKALRRSLWERLELRSNRFELCAEITAKLCRLGIPIHEFPISYQPRGYGDGKKIGVSAFFRCVAELIHWRFAPMPIADAASPSIGSPSTRSSALKVRLAALLLCTVGVAWLTRGYWLPAQPFTPAARESDRLMVTSNLNFGAVDETSGLRIPLEFRNTGDQPIEIDKFDTGCDCAVVGVDKLTIPPHEARSVTLTLDLTRKKPADRSKTTWPAEFPVRVAWREGAGTNRVSGWTARGIARSLLSVEPGAIWCGDELVRGTAGEPRTVFIRPLVLVDDLSIASPPAGFN